MLKPEHFGLVTTEIFGPFYVYTTYRDQDLPLGTVVQTPRLALFASLPFLSSERPVSWTSHLFLQYPFLGGSGLLYTSAAGAREDGEPPDRRRRLQRRPLPAAGTLA